MDERDAERDTRSGNGGIMFCGADTRALDAFGAQSRRSAGALRGARERIDTAVGSAVWTGPDAEVFRKQWRALADDIDTACADLESHGSLASRHAEEQDAASSIDGAEGNGGKGTVDDGDEAQGSDGRSPVPPHDTQQDPPVEHHDDIAEVLTAEEYEELSDLLDQAGDDSFRWNPFAMSQGEAADELAERLRELSPEQLSDFLNRSSTAELTAFADALRAHGREWRLFGSSDDWTYIETWSDALRDADPRLRDKIHAAFPESQPDTTTYVDDENRGTVPEGTPAYGDPGDAPLLPSEEIQQQILDQYRRERAGNPDAEDVEYAPWMDVNQQGYGDCWMLANLLAVVHEDPSWPAEHVVDNGDGTVTVTLYDHDGNPREVTVTDDLPMRADGTYQGAYAGPGGAGFGDESSSALWVAYVEKAMAAGFQDDSAYDPGQYEAIVGGWDQAAPYFTPDGSVDSVDVQDIAATYDSGGVPVAALTPDADSASGTAKDNPAYVTNHVFVLTDSYTANATTYYEFSNPHGPDKPPLVLTPEEFDEYFSGAGTY